MSSFANRDELLQHLTSEHQSDTFDGGQLSMIAGQSQGIKERPYNECLLCGFVVENEGQKDVPSKRESELWSEGSTKKLKTEHQSIPAASSSDDYGHKANDHESMTRHIAAHLHTLMFLTLRVLSMQRDTGPED
ncbi:hypothetical protein Forpe1208_v001900 [Fusarium oxysporum f. sp. rapae]|uniref:C2H2-type domain-containing protein n=1 Tax=Fusarium oxysporum f. sp. rapae TaxID=485398 RepID=A0A8J5PD36_FUSOX|nr:hypothetical protein Forpe1208_v001900 [Fusarium oxysporum f. sp. rapae]